jgi:hypothetical protein
LIEYDPARVNRCEYVSLLLVAEWNPRPVTLCGGPPLHVHLTVSPFRIDTLDVAHLLGCLTRTVFVAARAIEARTSRLATMTVANSTARDFLKGTSVDR